MRDEPPGLRLRICEQLHPAPPAIGVVGGGSTAKRLASVGYRIYAAPKAGDLPDPPFVRKSHGPIGVRIRAGLLHGLDLRAAGTRL